jgi:hypothetical protein
MLLQNHIGPELKSHQNESQNFVQNPSLQNHTKTKLIDRQIRHRFRLIQESVNRYIDLQIYRLNDHSTPLERNQNIQQRRNAAATKMNKYRNLHNTRWGEHDIVNNKY